MCWSSSTLFFASLFSFVARCLRHWLESLLNGVRHFQCGVVALWCDILLREVVSTYFSSLDSIQLSVYDTQLCGRTSHGDPQIEKYILVFSVAWRRPLSCLEASATAPPRTVYHWPHGWNFHVRLTRVATSRLEWIPRLFLSPRRDRVGIRWTSKFRAALLANFPS